MYVRLSRRRHKQTMNQSKAALENKKVEHKSSELRPGVKVARPHTFVFSLLFTRRIYCTVPVRELVHAEGSNRSKRSVAEAVPKPLVNNLEVHAGLQSDAGVRSEALRLQELAKGHAVVLDAVHHLIGNGWWTGTQRLSGYEIGLKRQILGQHGMAQEGMTEGMREDFNRTGRKVKRHLMIYHVAT